MAGEPRVFVSSVMRDFEAYRSAARQGIIDAGMKPILIEDFPSMDVSSRTACLDLVRSCDVYLVVIGDRPGASPLGKPVVEEEFDEARRRKLPRLMFLQNVVRDTETEALAHRLSDYVSGRFRATFDTPENLRNAVRDALRESSVMNIQANDPGLIDTLLRTEERESTPTLRLAFVPERKDEVFDVLEFDRPDLRRSMFKLAHRDDVRLFDFEQGSKESGVDQGALVLRQEPRRGSNGDVGVTIRIREDGGVVIDQTLGGRGPGHRMGFDMQIAESDVVDAIRTSVAFVNALYDERDPGHRYATFFYGAAAAGMSVYFLVKERRERNSWSLRTDDERGWQLLDKPRRIDRTDLANVREITERTLAFMVKRYGERT